MFIHFSCCFTYLCSVFFFFKQKTAYEMRISDWSSDVCSSDLWRNRPALLRALEMLGRHARADRSITSWLNLPRLLHSMEVTATPLPCLAIADKALRLTPRDSEAIVARFLRQIAEAAATGLQRLDAMEEQDRKSPRLNSSH